MIVKKGGQWCLMHKDGSGPPLGCHDSEEKAKAQETAINIAKAKRNEESLPGFRRLAGLSDDRSLPTDVPWDNPMVEGASDSWARPKMHDPQHYDYRRARYDLTAMQGYADLSKSAKLKLGKDDAISMAMALLVKNPTAKTTYIKDPSGLLDPAAIQKAAENWLTGEDSGSPSYGAFGFDNNDHEIYADGVEVFRDGEWGYEVTQAIDTAQNDELERNPPKVKVSRIKGKTSEGWRIDIDKPQKHYLDVGLKAGERRAGELSRKGIRPPPIGPYGSGAAKYPDSLNQKWALDPKKPKLERYTEQIRALLEEDAVRAEFLEACYEFGLTPPEDLSVEAMLEFVLDEEGKIKKGFKMVFGKLKKLGKTIGLAAAIGTAAMGGHQNLTHHRPERDQHGISFKTAAQQSRTPLARHHATTQAGRR